jgi:bacteriocin-like protein
MSDDKQMRDDELDQISGGVGTHPMPFDPIRPGAPPTHPGGAEARHCRPTLPQTERNSDR